MELFKAPLWASQTALVQGRAQSPCCDMCLYLSSLISRNVIIAVIINVLIFYTIHTSFCTSTNLISSQFQKFCTITPQQLDATCTCLKKKEAENKYFYWHGSLEEMFNICGNFTSYQLTKLNMKSGNKRKHFCLCLFKFPLQATLKFKYLWQHRSLHYSL